MPSDSQLACWAALLDGGSELALREEVVSPTTLCIPSATARISSVLSAASTILSNPHSPYMRVSCGDDCTRLAKVGHKWHL